MTSTLDENAPIPHPYLGGNKYSFCESLTEQGLPPSRDSCHLPEEIFWQWDVGDFRGEKGLL